MKKKILFSAILVVALLMLGGCFKKTALTTSDFKTKAEAAGYLLADVTSQYSGAASIKEATVALIQNKYQVEFYVLDSESSAVDMFETNKDKFESNIEGTSSKSEANMLNYSTYSLTNQGKYVYLSRVENTFLYLHVNSEYKDEVKKFIDNLGY